MTVGVFEAKTKFSELLDRVEAGEEIIVTRHGKPVARITPPISTENEEHKKKVTETVERMKELRKQTAGKATIEEILQWIQEGRRY